MKTSLLFLLLPIACSFQLLAQEAPPAKVEPKAEDSKVLIERKDAPLSVAPNNHIAISKRSIGKEFLISASVIPQIVSPTSTSLAGKLVRFEVFHDGVDLYESTDGLVVTQDLPARAVGQV